MVLLKTRQQVAQSQDSIIQGSIHHQRAERFTDSLIEGAIFMINDFDIVRSSTQVVSTPVDVISQRLMAQGSCVGGDRGIDNSLNALPCKYRNGVDAFRKILNTDGIRGLYRGFGISILTYAPSNTVWWASYSVAQRLVWSGVEWDVFFARKKRKGLKMEL